MSFVLKKQKHKFLISYCLITNKKGVQCLDPKQQEFVTEEFRLFSDVYEKTMKTITSHEKIKILRWFYKSRKVYNEIAPFTLTRKTELEKLFPRVVKGLLGDARSV